MRSAFATLAAALAALLIAPQASAFCRAHSCKRNQAGCEVDSRNCVIGGLELFWNSDCVRIGINEAGSVRHGISFEQLKSVTETAFQTWANATCPGGKPSIHAEVVGPIPCEQSEYNKGAGNINLVVFRDDAWPYVGGVDVLGTTLIRFNADTGEIWDADIEINGTAGPISLDGSGEIDLESLLTHEAGHVLGLDHSDLLGATMIAGYTTKDISLRTLEFDDVQGICAVHPSGAKSSTSCEPQGGFSDQCGGFVEPGPEPEPEPVPPVDDGGCGIAQPVTSDWSVSTVGMVAVASWWARRRRITLRAKAG